ncbi:NAD(P)/FAD-dependent oxidoreductase [Marinobacter xestospongiae]|uniref:NAD(P)/FAD-dependent oxidoreductase n=1 Tax=Marinobacter xestospongiae TaxID=994319 RepID=UPI002004062A|nr:FAD-dependent oxidoreductase [Marinobacter xestospongiae]MCK7567075.1 FAD-dependent oxidoreductase [Marinobacter xestospongiae]
MSVQPNTPRTLVICGHGMVAQRLLERLCDQASHPFERIVVLSGEPSAAYNRILLSSLLAGDADEASLRLQADDWFQRQGIERRQGDPVVGIDRQARQVVTASGHRVGYDQLVIATGSRSASLGLPGEQLNGVVGFRDLRDTRTLIELSQRHRRAVVIGGGFLGLEAAEGLRQRGMAVTVLHRSSHLLNRQLDRVGGTLLEQALSARGLSIRTGIGPMALLGNQQLRAVQLTDETLISTDLVVIAAGTTPNAEIGRDAGLACDRGILVDNRLQTSDPAIHALGECCQLGDQTFGLVEPGYEQADVLAQVLAQPDSQARFAPAVIATRLKISGIPIFSSGQTDADEHTDSVVWQDYETDRYCRLLIRDRKLTGAVLFGETSDGPWYHECIRQGDDITEYRANLAFGKQYCNAAA